MSNFLFDTHNNNNHVNFSNYSQINTFNSNQLYLPSNQEYNSYIFFHQINFIYHERYGITPLYYPNNNNLQTHFTNSNFNQIYPITPIHSQVLAPSLPYYHGLRGYSKNSGDQHFWKF